MKHRDDELDVVIREMKRQEYPLLEDFLWQAIDIPEGMDPPPRSILHTPALQVYLAGFGGNRSDQAFVAEIDRRVVGAAWARIMKDYGHIDAHTPLPCHIRMEGIQGAGDWIGPRPCVVGISQKKRVFQGIVVGTTGQSRPKNV